jgi:hypothetical protein
MLDVDAAAQQIAALHRERGGSTFNLYVGDLSGQRLYAVSLYPERSLVTHGAEIDATAVTRFIARNMDLLQDPRNSVGTWFDEVSGFTYLDVSATIADAQQAIALGQRYNQVAIFDLDRLEEIAIGGSGEEIPDLPPATERLGELRPRRRGRRRQRDG